MEQNTAATVNLTFVEEPGDEENTSSSSGANMVPMDNYGNVFID
jgi:hypothetical protein